MSKKELRQCTHKDCRQWTTDWYPITGGARLKHVRCAECFEREVRAAVHDGIVPFDKLQEREKKDTYKEPQTVPDQDSDAGPSPPGEDPCGGD